MFKLISTLLTGACILALHWYTGWVIILYLLGGLYSLGGLIILLGLLVVMYTGTRPYVKQTNKIQQATTYLYTLMYLVYFLFIGNIALALLLVGVTILALGFTGLCIKLTDNNVQNHK